MIDPLNHIFTAVGGSAPYYELVEKFYQGVESDPVLRPLYPDDLSDAKRNLALFLIQRTGGPTTYSDERGHPRMRARHMPFPIGQKERNAWMQHMTKALDEVSQFASSKQSLHAFFDEFATFMINKPG
ncbi:MAG TPA: globin [Chroococcales cyanobacterium]